MNTHLVGMVHLAALPGSPLANLSIDEIVEKAVLDATALQAGGADSVIVENFHDVPFRPGQVDPHTVAMMTRVCREVREAVDIEVGVNVLRNDGPAAIAIAAATGCSFIRVNIHTGAMLTDQGMISGQADETLRLRRLLGVENAVKILADVFVKHATPLGNMSVEDVVEDMVYRGLADGIIVSGSATGKAADLDFVRQVASSSGLTPVYVGSGITAANVANYLPHAAGVIVGSSLKFDGLVDNLVDVERVRALHTAIRAVA